MLIIKGYSNGKACKSENDTSNTENVTIINYQSDTDNYTKIIDILNHLRTSNEYLYIYSSGEDEDNIIDRTTHIAIGLKEDAIKFEVFGKVRYTTISNITRLECNPNKYHKLKFATVQV